ncbi:MAG: ricin-type beta-trefoil lectin domain protein [Proteobacteria bacterium]|nr:ricin-type beta-trefoil lectin domain protein [Pseudomonadota bacterium]
MIVFTADRGASGYCLSVHEGKHRDNQPVVLWDCRGAWNQQFRTAPFAPKAKDDLRIRIRTTGNKCVGADTRVKKALGRPAMIWECSSNPAQAWRQVAGKLVGVGGLCLRAAKGNAKGSALVMSECDVNPTVARLENEVAGLNERKQALLKKPPMRKMKNKIRTPFGQNKTLVTEVVDRGKLSAALKQIDSDTAQKSKQLAAERQKPTDKKSQTVDWVTVQPSPDPAAGFHEKYNVPSMAMLKMTAGNFCFDKDSSDLPRVRPHLWECNRKNGNQWFGFGAVSGANFALVSRNSKMCMDVQGASTRHGASVMQYPCHYGENQQWMAVAPGKNATDEKTFAGRFQIKSRKSGKCLAPVTYRFVVTYSKADQQRLDKMKPKERQRCESNPGNTGFLGGQFLQCPNGKRQVETDTLTRKKARFAQVDCKAGDRNQLFTLVR